MQENAVNRHSATTQILHEICALNWHTKYLHKAYTRFYFSVSDRDWLHIEFIACFTFLPILGLTHLKTKSIGLVTCIPFDFNVKTTSKLFFFRPFDSQGHIGTGPQHVSIATCGS